MPDRIKKQRFTFLAMLMMVIFCYPLISLANKSKTVAGVPLLFVYIAVAWVVSIILLYRSAEHKGPKSNSGS